jgi:hexosaminidase
LPKKKKIKTIEFSFLESNGSWIYLPHEIQVFPKSKRRKKKQSVKNINKELVRLKIRKRLETVRIEINTFSKIPKGLPGAGHTPWTFIDEIVFH